MLPFWSNAIITTTQDGNQALTHTATHMSEALFRSKRCENNSDFTKFEMLNPDSEVVHQYLVWVILQKRLGIGENFKKT